MELNEVLAILKKNGSAANVKGMERFAITASKAFGVPAPKIRALAKKIGTDHTLSAALWKSGWHEARILAAFIADHSRLTRTSAEKLTSQFESWAVCDTWCGEVFCYFPNAEAVAAAWTKDDREFVKRAGFVIMAAMAVHRKELPDALFRRFFPLIIRHADDDRNFVRKAVNWALRQIGKKNPSLNKEALAIARTLALSADATARWIGSDAVRDLQSDATRRRFERMTRKRSS